MRAAAALALVAGAALPLPGARAQCNIELNKCSATAPRQKGWTIVYQPLGGKKAAQLVDESLVGLCKVGPAISCANVGTQCHSWGQGFTDRNGVLFINGSTSSQFTVESWPVRRSLTAAAAAAAAAVTAGPAACRSSCRPAAARAACACRRSGPP
eukprot:COSAG04_NODE_12434_length_653_cov_0.925993_1_plen_154_part_01